MSASRIACLSLSLSLLACSQDPDDATGDPGSVVDTATTPPDEPGPVVELTPDLCDDPSSVQPVLEALQESVASGGPSYGELNAEQLQRMVQNPTEGPIYFVNLIRFRDQAVYADGRETDLTGREANDLYDALPFLGSIGARPVYVSDVSQVVEGSDAWEQVAIVEYPCPLATFAMSTHPEFQETSIHKDAGLEKSTILVTELRTSGEPDPGASPFPPTGEDPSFDRVQVVRRGDAAALDAYIAGIAEPEAAVGVQPVARFDVQGAYIGDGQVWDEVWIDRVPSRAAADALAADPDLQATAEDRASGIDGVYGLEVQPFLTALPATPGALGFEILEVLAADEIRVWISQDLTLAEFDALQLPQGWIKNQPREGDGDGGTFARSPDADEDGPLTEAEHFGFDWRHNATVIELNTPLDADGLLRLNRVAKFHELQFDAGRTLMVLVSPEGEGFVRVSRDAGRTSETPTLPEGWTLVDYVTDAAWTVRLPNPTENIRGDNEDSFQGPIAELQGLAAN